MKNKYLLGAVVLIIIITAAALFLSQNKTGNQEPQTSSESTDVLESGTQPEETVETTELAAVGGYAGGGTANRDYNGKTFVHLVVAQLPDPASGKFYEGWLVKKQPTLTFISTGKLEKEGGDDFVLLFTSETDYSDYNDVVITEETENLGLDGKPETHVLEGTFTN